MIELIVVLARLVQYAGATILFGAPLFYLYGLPADGPGAARETAATRRLVVVAALLAAIGCGLALLAQTAMMTGALADALDPGTLGMATMGTRFGASVQIRAAASLAALILAVVSPPSTRLWQVSTALGAVALASFAWSGHGADGEGAAGLFKLVADIIHLLAAGVWLGALAALVLLVLARQAGTAAIGALHQALKGFSGVGSLVVAALVLTGLINGWFLVGPDKIATAAWTAWGAVLLAKLAVFALMLGLAALNRFRLTPRLEQALAGLDPAPALFALRRSLLAESVVGLSVLVLVSWLGTLTPPAAL